MRIEDFPEKIRPYVIPEVNGTLVYRCLGCGDTFAISELLYTCPSCGKVLLLVDLDAHRLKETPPEVWRQIFDYRRMLNRPSLRGIYRYHEFLGPVLPLEAVVYLGEGHTPMVEANRRLQETVGARFVFKNDGQNPSA